MNLCKFKNIFGDVGTGIHRFRFLGIAIVDLALTIMLAYVISYVMKIDFVHTLFGLLLLGIILHRLFCVKTTVDIAIFGSN